MIVPSDKTEGASGLTRSDTVVTLNPPPAYTEVSSDTVAESVSAEPETSPQQVEVEETNDTPSQVEEAEPAEQFQIRNLYTSTDNLSNDTKELPDTPDTLAPEADRKLPPAEELDDKKLPPISNGPLVYVFTPTGANAMTLIPQFQTPGSPTSISRVYHVSWREDFLLPGNLITSIWRDEGNKSEARHFVGEFNLKANQKGATVRMGAEEDKWLDKVLNTRSGPKSYKWRYGEDSPSLVWTRTSTSGARTCAWERTNTSKNSKEVIATYTPPNYNTQVTAAQFAKLEVNLAAQDQVEDCDHIVLSTVLLERRRVTEVYARLACA